MKFLWLVFLALSALLLIETAKADAEIESGLQENTKENVLETKFLKEEEHDEENADDADEDNEVAENNEKESETHTEPSDKQEVEKSSETADKLTQEIIAEEDIAAFKEDPGMHRLARRLQGFHNDNVLARNSDFLQVQYLHPHDEEDEPLAEERAIRRRVRVRRRNIKNKLKRTNRNKQVANRRKNSKRNSRNRNSLRRKSPQRSGAKRTRNNLRKNYGKRSVNRGGLRRVTYKQGTRRNPGRFNKRSLNAKGAQTRRRLNKSKKQQHANKKQKMGKTHKNEQKSQQLIEEDTSPNHSSGDKQPLEAAPQ